MSLLGHSGPNLGRFQVISGDFGGKKRPRRGSELRNLRGSRHDNAAGHRAGAQRGQAVPPEPQEAGGQLREPTACHPNGLSEPNSSNFSCRSSL